MYYPWYFDPEFDSNIISKKEIYDNRLSNVTHPKRCLENYQYLVSNFINPSSPYRSLLLYFSTGVGKSISAISIAENFIRNNIKKQVIVITKSDTLISDFTSDLMNICSDYASPEELLLLSSQDDNERRRMNSIIKTRIKKHYTFVTHSGTLFMSND